MLKPVAFGVLLAGVDAFGGELAEPAATAEPTPACEECPVLREGCNSRVVEEWTSNAVAGGTLYVTKAADPTSWTQIINLADAEVFEDMEMGALPRHKPHMVVPSPNGKYAAISYTADKAVHIMDTATKKMTHCIRAEYPVPGVVGGTMHTVSWLNDDEILLDDMTGSVNGVGGGAIHKYKIDWDSDEYTYLASIAMGPEAPSRGTSGTKPIALGNNPLGEYKDLYFVTDAKGGASIINATSMTVEASIPMADLAPCKGGGLWVVAHPEDPAIVIAQYGAQDGEDGTVNSDCLFKVDMKEKAVTHTYVLPATADDTHGIQFCKNSAGEFFLLNSNRVSATLDVIDYATGEAVVSGFDLNANLPGNTEDQGFLQPDVAYYQDGTLFFAARGPEPLSAVKPYNKAGDATPGMFYLQLDECVDPTFGEHHALLTELDRSIVTSDVHGIWGVNDEIWVIDQAGTGSVQTYSVFSTCEGLGETTSGGMMGR